MAVLGSLIIILKASMISTIESYTFLAFCETLNEENLSYALAFFVK
jgi:hypothetical protein